MQIFILCKPYLMAHKYALVIYLLIIFASVCVAILSPYILGDFIDNLIQGADVQTIVRFCLFFGGLNLLRIGKGYISAMLYVRMQNKMSYAFNMKVIKHIQGLSLSYIHKKDIAYLNQRVTGDTQGLINFCINVLQNMITQTFIIIIPFVILFTLNPLISLLMLLFITVYVVLYLTCRKKLYDVGYMLRERQAKFYSALLEQLRYVKVIKTNVKNMPHPRLSAGSGFLSKTSIYK